jgi:hypothetical protein
VTFQDSKDWTWVLERACPECGFDASACACTEVATITRAQIAPWVRVLQRPDVAHRSRPDHWSALEYSCHVRDVFTLYDERLHLMLEHDDPLFANWDQDATAIESDYGAQEPARVTEELRAAATSLASTFDSVTGAQWQRRGRRSDGASFTIDSFARYFIHDPIHHLHDVGEPWSSAG